MRSMWVSVTYTWLLYFFLLPFINNDGWFCVVKSSQNVSFWVNIIHHDRTNGNQIKSKRLSDFLPSFISFILPSVLTYFLLPVIYTFVHYSDQLGCSKFFIIFTRFLPNILFIRSAYLTQFVDFNFLPSFLPSYSIFSSFSFFSVLSSLFISFLFAYFVRNV